VTFRLVISTLGAAIAVVVLASGCGSSTTLTPVGAAAQTAGGVTAAVHDSASMKVGPIISRGQSSSDAIAITPDGLTAYVVSNATSSVIPVTLASATAGTPIPVGYVAPSGGLVLIEVG
jgi:hypothetical protein